MPTWPLIDAVRSARRHVDLCSSWSSSAVQCCVPSAPQPSRAIGLPPRQTSHVCAARPSCKRARARAPYPVRHRAVHVFGHEPAAQWPADRLDGHLDNIGPERRRLCQQIVRYLWSRRPPQPAGLDATRPRRVSARGMTAASSEPRSPGAPSQGPGPDTGTVSVPVAAMRAATWACTKACEHTPCRRRSV